MVKTYKDLPFEEEIELEIWLSYLGDMLNNAHLQMRRWQGSMNFWDLQMFFLAMSCIDEVRKYAKRLLAPDKEFWKILKEFGKGYEKLNIKNVRDNIVHREKLAKLQNRKEKPLPQRILVLLGVYSGDNDEYVLGEDKIILSQAFDLLQKITQDIQNELEKRLKEYYETKEYSGMIPFTRLSGFKIDQNKE